jgi:lipopolysaccharide/colanic/teichoic acid biosynthesis glycosyltransferase
MPAPNNRRTYEQPSPITVTLKRVLDIVGSALGLVLLLPAFLAIAIAIKLDSPGPVFFRQERVGRGGRLFRIFKLRSMTADAPRRGTALTVHADKRITRVGALLRRSKLDELPQLLNVLAGDMSLVGPRPEVPEFMIFYTADQRAIITSMRPGMTDYASILFRNESALLDQVDHPVEIYRREIMPIKFIYYERYGREIGVLNDLRIILATMLLLVVGRIPNWLSIESDLHLLPYVTRAPQWPIQASRQQHDDDATDGRELGCARIQQCQPAAALDD